MCIRDRHKDGGDFVQAAADAAYPAEERKLVLQALAMQAHRPGFKAAAGPVIAVWRRLLAATGLACAPCEPAQRSSSDPV